MTPFLPNAATADWATVVLRAASALGLATIAALVTVVSYTHIHDVVLTHGDSPTAAQLIPVSVELILVASLSGLSDRQIGRCCSLFGRPHRRSEPASASPTPRSHYRPPRGAVVIRRPRPLP